MVSVSRSVRSPHRSVSRNASRKPPYIAVPGDHHCEPLQLFGIALLLRLRLGLWGALALAGLFTVEVGLTLNFLGGEAQTIASLTWLSWAYLALSAAVVAANAKSLGASVGGGPLHQSPRSLSVARRSGRRRAVMNEQRSQAPPQAR